MMGNVVTLNKNKLNLRGHESVVSFEGEIVVDVGPSLFHQKFNDIRTIGEKIIILLKRFHKHNWLYIFKKFGVLHIVLFDKIGNEAKRYGTNHH